MLMRRFVANVCKRVCYNMQTSLKGVCWARGHRPVAPALSHNAPRDQTACGPHLPLLQVVCPRHGGLTCMSSPLRVSICEMYYLSTSAFCTETSECWYSLGIPLDVTAKQASICHACMSHAPCDAAPARQRSQHCQHARQDR